MSLERNIVVVIASQELETCGDCRGYEVIAFDQTIHTFDEFLQLPWTKDFLREKGYYSKDDVSDTGFTHLNNFVYGFGSKSYRQYTTNINTLNGYNCDNLVVYQEVVGPERLPAICKLVKARSQYLKKEAERLVKYADKQKALVEKRRLRRIEKAKNLLKNEEGTTDVSSN